MSYKIKKMILYFLVITITAAMVMASGCQKNNITKETGQEDERKSQKTEILKLRYFHFWENKGTINAENDMVAPLIKEKFGIEFSEIINPTSEPAQKFKLMIASADVPDICLLPFAELSGANKYGTDGLFLDITDKIDKYENLKTIYTKYIKRLLTAQDGKIYSIPSGHWKTSKDLNYNQEGMWIKKSILEKLGISQTSIKTPDDLFNLCMRIKNEIGEYNGKPIIPYGLGPGGWGDSKFYLMFGADWHNLMPDGKSITFMPTHPGARDGLLLMYKMMNNGLIEKDAFIQTDAQWKEKLAQGRFAIIMHAPSIVYGELNPIFENNNPGDTYVPLSFPWAQQLQKYFRYPDNPISVTLISSKTKDPERILKMCDWIASDEGYLATMNGKEGVFYKLKDGKAVLTDIGINAKNNIKLQESYGLNGWYYFAGFDDKWKKLGGLKEADPRIAEASQIFATYKRKDDGTTLQPNPDTVVAPRVPFRNDGWGILFKIWKDAQMKALFAPTQEEALKIWDKALEDMKKQAADRMSKEFEEEYQNQLKILLEDKEVQEEVKNMVSDSY